ncbi:MAG: hypothetical protein ACSHYF_10210 [Verrucomicrobiaceae bacterium]
MIAAKVAIPVIVLVAIGMSEVVPRLWFPATGKGEAGMLHLREHEPSPDIEELPLSNSRAGDILSFDRSRSYQRSYLDDDPARSLTVIAMEYDPGNGRLWRDLFGHSPDICMPSSGAVLVDGPSVPGFESAFPNCRIQRYEFTHPAERGPLFVYKLVWLGFDNWEENEVPDFDSWGMRADFIWNRKSVPAASLILALITGYGEGEEADGIFESLVLANCQLKD